MDVFFQAGGKINKLTRTESYDFIARLSKYYGEPIHTVEFLYRDYNLYTWTLEDRILKYAVITTDESNVLKIEAEHNEDGDLTDLREGKRGSYLIGYLFLIDTTWTFRPFQAFQVAFKKTIIYERLIKVYRIRNDFLHKTVVLPVVLFL